MHNSGSIAEFQAWVDREHRNARRRMHAAHDRKRETRPFNEYVINRRIDNHLNRATHMSNVLMALREFRSLDAQ